MKTLLFVQVILLGLLSISTFGQLNKFEVAAIQTDTSIDLDFTGGDTIRHQIFVNPNISPKNKLLVFIPGTGGKPKDHYTEFCKTAANVGYHAIGLVYKNTISISDICGTAANNGPECSENARLEIIYGSPLSDLVDVDEANSIVNRLTKLLIYLELNFPGKGWENYIDVPTETLNWKNIALAGHSQGGGHAALLARDHEVYRVFFFNSPSDRNTTINTPHNQPSWFYDSRATPDSVYYAFYHEQNGGDERLAIYKLFGLGKYGLEVNVDNALLPYSFSHILYTDSSTFDFGKYNGNSCGSSPTFNPHSDIIIDCELPLDNAGINPYMTTWEYMLTNTTSNIVLSASTVQSNQKVGMVYPTVTSNKVFLKGLPKNHILMSSSGRILGKFHNDMIDFSTYPEGLYYIMTETSETTITNKVIKTSR